LLSNDSFLRKLTLEERKELIKKCLINHNAQSIDNNFGSVSNGYIIRLLAKLLIIEKNESILEAIKTDTELNSFIDFQTSFPSEQMAALILEKVQAYIASENEDNLLSPIAVPTVNTTTQVLISYDNYTGTYTYQLGGSILNTGGSNITSRGVIIGTSNPPSTQVSIGSGSGSFSAQISPFNQGVKYYVRAFAKNSSGTGYGNTISFTTCGYSNARV